MSELDLDAIADARTDIPALVAEVRKLRRRVEFYESFQIYIPALGRHVTIPEILNEHPDMVGVAEDYA